jgi:TMEM175 potassium channel family protein
MEPSSESAAEEAAKFGLERMLFFSDAVFAIAITLLVLDLKPAEVMAGDAVRWSALVSKLAGFGLSFFVIGQYWMAHHGLFAGAKAADGRLLGVNLAFLAAVAFVPFSTSIIIETPPARGPVLLYMGSMVALGLSMVTLARTARRPQLLKPGESAGETARLVIRSAGPALVFLLALGIAFFDGRAALWSLLLLIPVGPLASRIGAAVAKRKDAAHA